MDLSKVNICLRKTDQIAETGEMSSSLFSNLD